MSIENLSAFQARIAADAELQQKMAAWSQLDAATAAEKIATLSVEVGTPITAEELLAPRELSEAELDGVAGGLTASGSRFKTGGSILDNILNLSPKTSFF